MLALDAADRFKCIALISMHSWEATHLNNNGPQRMSHNLTEYAALRARFDPDHKKLWVATEYGSRTDTINGHTFNHTVSKCYDQMYTQTELPPDAEILSTAFATRVAAFTLLHMNAEFDSALYWWVEDYGWATACMGLTSRNGTATPPLHALTQMFMLPGLELSALRPVRRGKLTPAPDDDTVTAGAVGAGGAVLWVAHAPGSGKGPGPWNLQRTFEVAGLPASVTLSGTACYPDASSCTATQVMTTSEDAATTVSITLVPDSIVALTFKPPEGQGDDLNDETPDLVIDASNLGRAAEQRAAGVLDGMGCYSGDSPHPDSVPDALLVPLHFHGYRGCGSGEAEVACPPGTGGCGSGTPDSTPDFYHRLHALGFSEVQMLLMELWPDSLWNAGIFPGQPEGNWTLWDSLVRQAVAANAGRPTVTFEIW